MFTAFATKHLAGLHDGLRHLALDIRIKHFVKISERDLAHVLLDRAESIFETEMAEDELSEPLEVTFFKLRLLLRFEFFVLSFHRVFV